MSGGNNKVLSRILIDKALEPGGMAPALLAPWPSHADVGDTNARAAGLALRAFAPLIP